MLSGRRGLGTAVLLCLVGAFVVLVGAGRVWASAEVPTGPITGPRQVSVSGTEVVAGVRALGLVGLAGVPALLATRRTGRVVVALLRLLTGAGVGAAVLGADAGAAVGREASAVAAGAQRMDDVVLGSPWPVVTALGGGVLALAGLLTVVRGRSWPGLGQRYEAPAVAGAASAAAAAAVPTGEQPPRLAERGLWEALDRGEDPTGVAGAADPSAGTPSHGYGDLRPEVSGADREDTL